MRKIFSVFLACMVTTAAFVQETPDSNASTQETGESLDFVITAGRTPEEAAKVAGQVTVITADDIAESGATSVVDVLQTVPGIRVARDRLGTGFDLSMRGVSSDSGRGKVLVIVDGMRLNPIQALGTLNWDTINLSEIERIEVLDGGASVQYGDNASAGVVNIITKKSGEAKTDITVSGGSFFQNEQRFSHHQPTDWGGFTVSGGHRGTHGYQKHGASDTGNGEFRGIFDINDTMSLQANVGFSFTNNLLANSLTKAEFDDDPTQNKGPSGDGSSSSIIDAGAGFIWVINETLSFDVPVFYNFTNVKHSLFSNNILYDITPHMIGIRPKLTAELRPAGMGLRFTGGIDTLFAFSEVKTSYDLVKETNPAVQRMSEFTIGPWVLANFEPLKFLSLNVGLRYDAAFVNAHVDDWSGMVMGSMPATYTSGDESTKWNAFVYEVGVTVNPLDFLKVYAKYGTQFRYPLLDDVIVVPMMGGTVDLNTDIEPEKGWTIEGGVGLNIGSIARLDANFYYLRIDNEILTVMNPPSYTNINMDPIDRIGTNIGLQLKPIKYMELDFDYGYVNAKFTEGPFEGKIVPLVAQHTLSGSLMVSLPFGLSFGPNVLFKSEIYQGLDNANAYPAIDPSLVWGLQARYVIDKFKGNLALQLTIHNLANTKHTSMVYVPIPPLTTESTYYADRSMGRSVNVSVQYRF
jgi:iron complex outermembrane receptor protein